MCELSWLSRMVVLQGLHPLTLLGFPILQFIAAICGNLSILSSGMHYGWSSPSLPKLLTNDTSYISLTKAEISWIPVAMPCGGLCGALIASYIMNKVGRKCVILLTAIPTIASWLLIALAKSVNMILIARFLAGAADGVSLSSLPIYIAEISEPRVRGILLSGITFTWISGMLLMNALGSYLTIPTTAYISLAIPALFLVTFLWMPESPYYLIMKGKLEQGRKCVVDLKMQQDVDSELNRIQKAIADQENNKTKFKDVLSNKANRKSLLIMMGTRGAQQWCGITCIMFYAQIIFEEAGNDISPKTASIIYFGLYLFISGLSTVIVDKTGRKPLLIISTAGTAIVLLIETCYFFIKNTTNFNISHYSIVPIIGLILYITVFSIGLQTVPLLIIGEIFPLSIKSLGVGFAAVFYDGCVAVIVQVFQHTMNAYGLHIPFLIFTICSILGLLFIVFCVPETAGKTLEEIEDELNK